MARFLVGTLFLAVCVSYAAAEATWGGWTLMKPCPCGYDGYNGYPNDGYGQQKYETWKQECYGSDCDRPYVEQQRPCECREEPVLSAGEIAGIVVGAVVFLILIIIIIIWCFYCGCECDGGRGMRRWGSDDSIYRGKVIQAPPPTVVSGPHVHAPSVQAFHPAPVTYAVPAAKPISFQSAVVQQGPIYAQHAQNSIVQHQHGAVYARKQSGGPVITVLN